MKELHARGLALIWLLIAATSLLTTKRLLDHELHFPMHLALLQLTCLLAWKILCSTVGHAAWRLGIRSTPLELPSLRCYTTNRILHTLCISGALLCAYQAIHHHSNLPVVVMAFSLLLQIAGNDSLASLQNLKAGQVPKQASIVVGVALIFMFDFRTSVVGIIMLLLLAIFLASAQSLSARNGKIRKTEPDCASTTQCSQTRDGEPEVLDILGAILLAAFWCHFREQQYWNPRPYNPLTSDVPALVLNLVCTILLLTLTKWAWQPGYQEQQHVKFTMQHEFGILCRSVSLICLLVIGSSWSTEIPPLISPWQIIGFGLASIAVLPVGSGEATKTNGFNMRDSISNLSAIAHKLCYLLAVVVPIFSTTLALNFMIVGPALSSSPKFRLGPSSQSTRPLDIVVARYDEPVSELATHITELLSEHAIQRLSPNIVVYDKGEAAGSSASLEDLSRLVSSHPSPTIAIKTLGNIGRETDTYLEHIVANWNDLADHTLFIQAGVHNPGAYLRQIRHYFVPSTGFLSLGPWTSRNLCSSCDRCLDRDWTESPFLLRSIFSDFNQGAECKDVVLTYRGQFIASAARIRGNDKATYERWLDELRQPDSVLHTAPYTESVWSRKDDSLSAPRAGFTFERIWGMMLQCNEKRIAYRCPAFLSTLICPPFICGVAALEDCQCLDS